MAGVERMRAPLKPIGIQMVLAATAKGQFLAYRVGNNAVRKFIDQACPKIEANANIRREFELGVGASRSSRVDLGRTHRQGRL